MELAPVITFRLSSNGAKKLLQVFAVGFSLLFCSPLLAQLNLGRIYGGVTDQTGGIMAGATVTVVDVARGVSRPLTTDRAGEYNAPSLLPGTYTVRVEAKGFQTLERQNIAVGVGQEVRVDLTLQPGAQNQTITVTETLPIINTTNATLGGTVDNQALNDLPLNGRLFTKLLDYQPGIMAVPGKNTFLIQSNGNRQQTNVWMFDGIDDFDLWAATGPLAGQQNTTILPIDAIQEVNVVENPPAQYGWKPGSVVNVGLKSGSNSIHGSAYAYGRDTALDAKNAFLLPTQPKPTDQMEQFGATIGGPIKKDKLFYFGGYEGQRFTIGGPQETQVPTAVSLGGGSNGTSNSFPDAIAALEAIGYCNPAAAGCAKPLSQLSMNLAGCALPAGLMGAATCNASNGVFGNSYATVNEPVSFNNLGTADNVVTKIDYHINDHHSLTGEYFYGNATEYSPGSPGASGGGAVQAYWGGDSPENVNLVRGTWIWTPNSSWLNEARFGYSRENGPSIIAECDRQLGQPNYLSAFGLVTIPGYPSTCKPFPVVTISGFSTMGATTGGPVLLGDWSGLDTVSYTRGRHEFKFGAEIHYMDGAGAKINNTSGVLTFGTPAAFSGATPLETYLVGAPSTGTVLVGNGIRTAYNQRYALFAQDDWRLIPRLMLNLGLRWEYVPPITVTGNQLGNFDPTSATGLVQAADGQPVYRTDKTNFAPRLGLAWDVTGNGKTVVRAGASIVDDSLLGLNAFLGVGSSLNTVPTGFSLVEANGSKAQSPGNIAVGNVSLSANQLQWATNTPIFNVGTSALVCGNGLGSANALAPVSGSNPQNPAPCTINGVDQNFRTPYVTTWTLGVQHAFTNNLSLNLSYVGDHGTDLYGNLDINQATPGAKNTGSPPGSGNEQLRRPYYSQFPYLGQIFITTPTEESNFNALEASLTQRVTRGLTFNAGYTFAHSLDDNSSESSAGIQDSAAVNQEYGNSSYDVRNHFSVTVSYAIPGRKSPGQILEGWQVNSAIIVMGGFPYNAEDTTSDVSGTGDKYDRWTILGSPSNIQGGGPSTIPCFGVSGSSFAASCITVASVANMPAACLTAAMNEPSGVNTGMAELGTLGCYYENGTAIVPPAQGTFGSMGRNVLRGKGFSEWDFSFTKDWKFKERLTAQFRGEFFNILNRTDYAIPSGNPSSPTSFGESQGTPNIVGSGASLVNGTGGPRTIQLGLKFIF